MIDEYTPTMDDLVDGYAYCTGIGPVIGERRRALAKRAIAAHDRALREQMARDLMEKLPRILAETSVDSFGWLAGYTYAAKVVRGEGSE